jgi:hypothetical protein
MFLERMILLEYMFLERIILLHPPHTSTSHVRLSIFHTVKDFYNKFNSPFPQLPILKTPLPFAGTLMGEAETRFVLTKSLCESGHQERILVEDEIS